MFVEVLCGFSCIYISLMLIEVIIVRQLCVLCLFYVNRDSGMLTGLPNIIQLVKSCDHLETEFRLLQILAFIMTSTLGSCIERITPKNHCLSITCSTCLLCSLQGCDLQLDTSGLSPAEQVLHVHLPQPTHGKHLTTHHSIMTPYGGA